jgi:hypothetical protein
MKAEAKQNKEKQERNRKKKGEKLNGTRSITFNDLIV